MDQGCLLDFWHGGHDLSLISDLISHKADYQGIMEGIYRRGREKSLGKRAITVHCNLEDWRRVCMNRVGVALPAHPKRMREPVLLNGISLNVICLPLEAIARIR